MSQIHSWGVMDCFAVKWPVLRAFLWSLLSFLLVFLFVSAEGSMKHEFAFHATEDSAQSHFNLYKAGSSLLQPDNQSGYQHVWPEMKLGWRIIVGTIIGFFGAAFGSVGGVGGGGIFVPMLSVIIGFDPKSSTALSKCMIMGAAASTVYYNLKLRHPTLDMPIIDYDLVLIIQPVLMLGISIGVTLSVIFADWMITVLLIILCVGTAAKAFLTGTETWKRETIWKEIAKNYTTACSVAYWVFNILQVPVSAGVFLYEAVGLYKGHRVIPSRGDAVTNWRVHQLVLCCLCGILAGIVGGLLGIGGGFVMGPLFIELGIPSQVASATATFGMAFSSSMSVVQYYLLNRFPVPYALYLIVVAIIAAFIGQHLINKLVTISGRASLIIFVLAFTIFVSAVSLGWVGILNTIEKTERNEYMGFENLCKYDA